jgi:multimeric flavodoxin WrbA
LHDWVVSLKVIAIQSSPNRDGLTSSLAQSVLNGVKTEGGTTELIHLNEQNLKHCIACENGWGICRTEGICILEDDFESIREKIADCDAFVFATPVYFGDLSESAKVFFDRLRRIERGKDFGSFKGKKTIGIASAGGGGGGAVRALHALENYLRRLGFDVFDLVSVTKFSKDHKLEMLERAGQRLASE